MLVRTGILIYAAVAYLVAMVNLAYLIGFLADAGVPRGINDGPESPVRLAMLMNVSRSRCSGCTIPSPRGPTSRDMDGAGFIWQFFAGHLDPHGRIGKDDRTR